MRYNAAVCVFVGCIKLWRLKYLIEENLYETIANGDGTMDLRFEVNGKVVWIKGASVPDDIGEFYFDDVDNLRTAVETGMVEY